MGSRPGFIRGAVKPGWSELDLGSSLDRRKHRAFVVALDRRFIAARHGAVGVGEMEDRCRGASAGRDVFRRRVRAGDQRCVARSVGTLHQHRLFDGNGLDFSVWGRHGRHDHAVAGMDRFADFLCALARAAEATGAGLRGGQVSGTDRIAFEEVSKFYGEILGVNRVNLSIPPGITTLVGPNGAGKTTVMNLMTGLIQPSNGKISVLGLTPADALEFFSAVGYCAQFDFFPRGITGWQFILDSLMLHGMEKEMAVDMTVEALDRVQLGDAANRKVAGYSKGMRQKIRLAQAIAHHPRVLVLDEPVNGLDPMARAESIAL